jgi:PAS domain S-box-containing protein
MKTSNPPAPSLAGVRADVDPLDDHTLATLLRDLTDAVVVADRHGTIVFWNEAATTLFGWSPADAVGQTLDLIIPERFRQRHWEGFDHAMATGVTRYAGRVLEVPALRRSGEPLSIAFTVTILRSPTGSRPHMIAAVIRDDTERWNEKRATAAELEQLRRQVQPPDDHRS